MYFQVNNILKNNLYHNYKRTQNESINKFLLLIPVIN